MSQTGSGLSRPVNPRGAKTSRWTRHAQRLSFPHLPPMHTESKRKPRRPHKLPLHRRLASRDRPPQPRDAQPTAAMPRPSLGMPARDCCRKGRWTRRLVLGRDGPLTHNLQGSARVVSSWQIPETPAPPRDISSATVNRHRTTNKFGRIHGSNRTRPPCRRAA